MAEVLWDLDVAGAPDMVDLAERLVIAPCSGRFVPLPPATYAAEGEWIEEGQTLAHIRAGNDVVPVVSAFAGWMMGMLAMAGQPVTAGAALFRVRR